MIIESKVLIPAVAGFVTAVLALAAAFGLDLSDDQRNAILGAAVAAVVLLQTILGYLAPHTARPDLDEAAVADAVARGARHAHANDAGLSETGAIALVALIVAVVCLIIVL